MISFDPKISLEIGSIASICCSIFCAIVFYYWYRKTIKKETEMNATMDKLATAFENLTNLLMESDDETKDNDTVFIPNTHSSDPHVHRVWDSGKTETISKDS